VNPARSSALAAALGLAAGLALCARDAAARGCREVSQVVGRMRCGWGTGIQLSPVRASFAFGSTLVALDARGTTFYGSSAAQGTSTPFRFEGARFGAAPLLAMTQDFRLDFFLWRALYLGIEASMGVAGSGFGQPVIRDPSGLTLMPMGFGYAAAGLAPGVAFAAGPVRFHLEALIGGRGAWIETASFRGEGATVDNAVSLEFLLRARAGISYNVTPWFSLGMVAGVDATLPVAYSGSFLMQWHTRAYDGLYDR
jgi:hypothetical protein